MKLRFLLIPMVLATTSAIADPSLSSLSMDGQSKAAALLSGARTDGTAKTDHEVRPNAWMAADGQAKAAALLSRPRTT